MSYHPYDETQLMNWTQDYWGLVEESRYAHYLGPKGYGTPSKPLLQIEMECAQQMDRLPVRREKTTLVLLVGTSYEPLLQAICAYQPDHLVPVVNQFYGDRDELSSAHQTGEFYWQDLCQLIMRISPALVSLPEIPTVKHNETVPDNPQAVFDYLRQELADDLVNPERRVVIDITGAKKTMVAGAYLLAAYSRAAISYVDFERWNDRHGKPYGYSCRIRDDVPNPLQDWALQDWERVKEQYDKYNFAAAIEAIPQRGPSALIAASEKLMGFLEVCASWEAGDLATAKQLHDKLPADLQRHTPLAVKELSRFWVPLNAKREDWLKPDFLLEPRALLIYAEDELARASRLANHKSRPDNRAAFIRAYAVYETLIKAQALILFETRQTTIDPSTTDGATLREWMFEKMVTRQAKDLLAGGRVKRMKKIATGRPHMTRPLSVSATDEENLTSYRHLFVHSYVPVSSHLVSVVIEMARAYLNEFKENWGETIVSTFNKLEIFDSQAFDIPPWHEVKKLCGLDVLLPTENIEEAV